jgi:[methyl-Co(III) methanol-specific corrinoid protein]:coenzyme M methyltransferase
MAETAATTARARVLGVLAGRRLEPVPCFSGLISVTRPGLDHLGLRFGEVHADPERMAAAALTTHQLFGFEAATLPLDLCVEASALGAQVDFRVEAARAEFPRVVAPLAASPEGLDTAIRGPVAEAGRVPLVLAALRSLRAQAGPDLAVGAWLPGPMTLAMQVVELGALMGRLAKDPAAVGRALDGLTDLLIEVGGLYRAAGADFLTIHEMGGSPGFIGPPAFGKLVQPRLKRLLAGLPAPRVLSVCGDTNRAMPLLAECGAEALSVDQTNRVGASRAALGPSAVLFGNIDPVGVLAQGDDAAVRQAVRAAVEAGVDAVWPGCDLWPEVPADNLRALVEAARETRRN